MGTEAALDALPPGLAEAARSYLDHLWIERGLSRHTIAAYRVDVSRYLTWISSRGIGAAAEITRADVSAFATALGTAARDGGSDELPALAPRSVARTIVAVRRLHAFWAEEGVSAENVASDVRPPQMGRRLPKALDHHQTEALLAANPGEEPPAVRARALLEFLYATGARVSEAVGVDLDDLDTAASVVRLYGKGDKERLVPFGSFAREALEAWLVRARPAFAARGGSGRAGAVFLNARGGRLSRQSAWTILKDSAARAGLPEGITPHTLRHTFATHLMEGGADVRIVQELLGHASVTTTQIYTKVTAETLREVYATSHPRAR